MPSLRISFDDHEIERRNLTEAVIIGRSPDCDVAVRDVLLSRRHCRVAPREDGSWQVVDLSSKNGTALNRKGLAAPEMLRDGDEMRLGRLTASFFSGRLEDAGLTELHAAPLRPADPNESLSGTCAGFAYLEPGQSPSCANFPKPRPSPRVPAAFERDDVYSLLSSIASSSWDSIYAEARRPLPAGLPLGGRLNGGGGARHRPRSPIDLSLQVSYDGESGRGRTARPRTRRMAISAVRAVVIVAIFSLKFWNHTRMAAAAVRPEIVAPASTAAISIPVSQTAEAEVIVRSAAPFWSLLL